MDPVRRLGNGSIDSMSEPKVVVVAYFTTFSLHVLSTKWSFNSLQIAASITG